MPPVFQEPDSGGREQRTRSNVVRIRAADTDPAEHVVRDPDDLAGMTVRACRAVALG
jgi:hypothetical protein